jgi:hypothetical protein
MTSNKLEYAIYSEKTTMPDSSKTDRMKMIKRFLKWGMQDISLSDFIGVAFVTPMVTMSVCLSLLIDFDVLN